MASPRAMRPRGISAVSERLLTFLKQRFRNENEAAMILGSGDGHEAVFSKEEFARTIRMAGFRDSPQEPFIEFSRDDDQVYLIDLLRFSGLMKEASSPEEEEEEQGPSRRPSRQPSPMERRSAGTLSPSSRARSTQFGASYALDHIDEAAAADLNGLRREVEAMRRDLGHLHVRLDGAASHEDLLQERGGRHVTETAMRQLGAKMEEGLSRESVALRADCADLRASLTEALGLLAQTKQRQQEQLLENEKKLRELQHWADERIARLESVSRAAEMSGGENKVTLKSIEQMLHATEFRLVGLLGEETRAREASIASEKQVREASDAELEGRWRALLNEERGVRVKEQDIVAEKFATVHDKIRMEKELQNERANDVQIRLDGTLKEINEEQRQRQADLNNVHSHVEDVRSKIGHETRERKDIHSEHCKRHDDMRGLHEQHVGSTEKELAMLQQTCLDLRAAIQVEATAREEAVAKLHAFVGGEARSREDCLRTETSSRLAQEKAFEQHFIALLQEERSTREDAEVKLDAKIAALHHEHGFEKAKVAAQARELAATVAHQREALQTESSARKQDLAAATKGIYDLRDGFDQEKALRDKAEQRWMEHLTDLHSMVRDETAAREVAERKVVAGHAQLKDSHEGHARSIQELETLLLGKIEEERRIREEALQKEITAREDGDAQAFRHLSECLTEETNQREQGHKALEQSHKGMEQVHSVDRLEREEHIKALGSRLSELGDELADARQRLRDATARCDRLNELKDLFQQERTARQTQETNLEVALKELQVRMDQQAVQLEHGLRKHEQSHEAMHEKVEAEVKSRSRDLDALAMKFHAECDRQRERHEEHGRNIAGLLDTHKGEIRGHLDDHQTKHHEAVGELRARHLEMAANVEEARKHRNEHYNELVLETSKLSEMLADETKARMHQDQALEAELSRLRETTGEEVANRRKAVDGFHGELRSALQRIEQLRDAMHLTDKERGEAYDKLHGDHSEHRTRIDTGMQELKQMMDREVLAREEMLAASTRTWQKTSQQMRDELHAKQRGEHGNLEQAIARLAQDMQDLRGDFKSGQAATEHTTDDLHNRVKACTDGVATEERDRKAEFALLRKALDDCQRALAAEHSERASGEQHTSDRFLVLEGHFRDEAAAREDGDRRNSKDILDLATRMQAEQAAREDHANKLDRQLGSMSAAHEERWNGESKNREAGHATVCDKLAKGLQDEQAGRAKDRKELVAMLQGLQQAQQLEHEDRVKADRDLSANLARLQSMEKEEEESRIEQGERLTAALESVQEGLRTAGVQREETMKRCMDGVDQIKAGLNQESQARQAKDHRLDETLRDVSGRLQAEVRDRTTAVNAAMDAVAQERAAREEVVLRERKLSEEDVHRALQTSRKAREDEERKMNERIIEISANVSKERDTRQEAVRQQSQQTLLVKEELVRDLRALKAELSAHGMHVEQKHQEHAKRALDIEDLANLHAAHIEGHRAEISGMRERHETAIKKLEQRSLDLHAGLETASKEPERHAIELQRHIDEEFANLKASIATERRLRETIDQQSALALKDGLRSEAEAREATCASISGDLASVKAQLASELGRHDDKHSDHQACFQKFGSDLAELQSSRKVDLAAMNEALGHVAGEMKAVAQQRKEDLEGVQGHLTHLGSTLEEHSRTTREGASSSEQALQVLQAELQREIEARNSLASKLEVRLKEEHRIMEAALATEKMQREAGLRLIQESRDNDLNEEMKKTRATQDRIHATVVELGDDLTKERDTNSERVRELARSIAALQGVQTNEERARKTGLDHLQQLVDAVRQEVGSSIKKWNTDHQAHVDEIHALKQHKSQHEEKIDSLHKKLGSETAELKQAIANETRRRLATPQDPPRGPAEKEAVASVPATNPVLASGYPGGTPAEFRDLKRKTEEDLLRQRRQVETLQAEHQALAKSVGGVSERVDAARSGLMEMQGSMSEIMNSQKALSNVGLQLDGLRSDVQKEIADRKSDQERLVRTQGDLEHKLDRQEQQRLAAEDRLRQDAIQAQAGLKKDIREHACGNDGMQVSIREEKELREEAFARESRLRQDGQEQIKKFFQDAMREERRVREKEILRLEGRSAASPSGLGKSGLDSLGGESAGEIRGIRQALGDTMNRVNQVEQRQKQAEERTVNMFDTLMSGLHQSD